MTESDNTDLQWLTVEPSQFRATELWNVILDGAQEQIRRLPRVFLGNALYPVIEFFHILTRKAGDRFPNIRGDLIRRACLAASNSRSFRHGYFELL